MTRTPPKLLGPWRRAFQWGTTLALLLLPWLRSGGESLLRLDVTTLTLHAFGAPFRIEELSLFLLLALTLVLLFLLLTLILGRAWCGWACPQTTLTDLSEGFARLLGAAVSAGRIEARSWQRLALHLFHGGISALFAANLLWYFISPYEFFPRLFAGTLGGGAELTLLVVAVGIFLNLTLVRRLLCREFCPYGRFQTVLVDPGTLTLRFHPDEASRCIRCGACVRSCPTGIDIREGYQVECINCGRCLDACRKVMARLKQPGIIRYTFGLEGRGLKALINPRMALVAVVFFTLTIALTTAVSHRSAASFNLARRAEAASRLLADGTQATFFIVTVSNRLRHREELTLSATLVDGTPIEIRGPVQKMNLDGGEKKRLDFALISPPSREREPLMVLFTLEDAENKVIARKRAFITATKDSTP